MAKSSGKKIRGVTIELGGDATGLLDEFYKIDGELKKTQAALKDTNRLLKLDPGNVELLRQKQGQLTEAIDGTEKKLEALKEAAEEAYGGAVAGDEKAQKQYEVLQREIIETEQNLKSLKDQMKDFGSVAAQQIAAAGQKVKDFGDKMSKAGTAMTKYVTGPIVAVGTAAVAAFTEVDDGLDIIVKKTGATGRALEDMEDAAKNLATSIPTDFRTAGEAVGEVSTRFGLTGKALEDLSGKFIKFAELNDTDVTSSIDSVQAAMAAFGVDAGSAGDVLDMLNRAAQDTGTDVNKLTDDLTSNAAALQEMGFGINSAAGFLASLNKNGVDSSTVMTGLKKALQNATKDGVSMDQALSDLTGRIRGAKSETEAMQTATELFGAKAAPSLVKAIRDGRLSFDELANSVKDYGDSVDSTFEATLDPIDQFKTTLNELKIVGADLVNAAAPLIKSVAEGLKNMVSGLRSAWEGLSPQMQETIIKLAGIAAAVGPVLVVGGKLARGISDLMESIPKLISSGEKLISNLGGIGTAALAAADALLVLYDVQALKEASETYKEAGEAHAEEIDNALENYKKLYTEKGKEIADQWAKMVYDVDTTGQSMEEAMKTLTGKIDSLWDGVPQDMWEGFSQGWDSYFGKDGKGVGALMEDAFTGAVNGVKGVLGIHSPSTVFKEIGDNIVAGLTEALAALSSLADSAAQWGRDLIQNFINGIKQMWENAKRAVSDFAQMIKNFLGFSEPKEGPLSNFHTYAPDMVDMFVKGLKDNQQRVANQLAQTFGIPEQTGTTGQTANSGAVREFTAPVGGGQAGQQTAVLMLDGQVVGRVFYPLIQNEGIRLGVQLAR